MDRQVKDRTVTNVIKKSPSDKMDWSFTMKTDMLKHLKD